MYCCVWSGGMKKRFRGELSDGEHGRVGEMIAAGTAPARTLVHSHLLLKADEGSRGPGWADEPIADAVEISQPAVSRVRKQYVRAGLDAAPNNRWSAWMRSQSNSCAIPVRRSQWALVSRRAWTTSTSAVG